MAAVHQVPEPSGAGDGDVDALAQGTELVAEPHTAVEGVDSERPGAGQRGELGGDLRSELTGRGQHEPPGPPRAPTLEPCGHGQCERQRLARSGRGLAAHVAPGEGVGERGRLDGERHADAAALENLDELSRQVELAEGQGGRVSDRRGGQRGNGELRSLLHTCNQRRDRGYQRARADDVPGRDTQHRANEAIGPGRRLETRLGGVSSAACHAFVSSSSTTAP